INIESHAPVALDSDAWNVRYGSDGATTDFDAINVATLDPPGNEAITNPAIRCDPNPARAHAVAGADLDQLSLDPVRHFILLRVGSTERCSAGTPSHGRPRP